MSRTNLRSISYLKHHTADVFDEVTRDGQPATITQNGEAKVVVMDVRTYDAWKRALVFSKLMALAEEDVLAGRVCSTDDAFARAEAAIEAVEDASD